MIDDEIEAVKLESKKTLELTQFVDHDEIDVHLLRQALFRRAGRRSRRGGVHRPARGAAQDAQDGLGQLALRGREYVVSLKPCGRGMVLETLRYADEVNKARSYFRDIGEAKPDEDLLDLAATLIDRRAGKFDASEFHDRYVDALKDLIERSARARRSRHEEEEAPAPRARTSST